MYGTIKIRAVIFKMRNSKDKREECIIFSGRLLAVFAVYGLKIAEHESMPPYCPLWRAVHGQRLYVVWWSGALARESGSWRSRPWPCCGLSVNLCELPSSAGNGTEASEASWEARAGPCDMNTEPW